MSDIPPPLKTALKQSPNKSPNKSPKTIKFNNTVKAFRNTKTAKLANNTRKYGDGKANFSTSTQYKNKLLFGDTEVLKSNLWTTTNNEKDARKAFIPLDTSIKLYNPYDYRARKLNNSRKIIRFTPEEIRVIMEKEPSNLMKPLNLMHYLKVQQKIENNSTTAKKRANTMRDNLNIFNGNMYPIYENPVKNMTNEEEAKLKEEAKLNNEKKFIMAIKSKGYDIYLADLIDKEPKILTLQNLAKYTEGDLIARGIPKFKARAILQIAK